MLRTALPATTVEKVNLADVFQAAIQLCRPKAEEKKIRIDLDCEKDTTAIFDPALIEQAYGGHVAVESKLGEGSRFSIHQPQTQ